MVQNGTKTGHAAIFQQLLPKVLGLPSLFKQPLPRVWVFQASFSNPFRGFSGFQASLNNPSEGIGSSRSFQQPLPRLPNLFKQSPPKGLGLPGLSKQPFQGSKQPLRGHPLLNDTLRGHSQRGASKPASNNPSEAPPKLTSNNPPREDGFQKTGFPRLTITAQRQHFRAPRQKLSEGLVEGRTVTEGVG